MRPLRPPLTARQWPGRGLGREAQKGAGIGYEKAEEILKRSMPVHRTILPKIVYQIENLINLDRIPSKVKVVAPPARWKTESAPARVIALLDE